MKRAQLNTPLPQGIDVRRIRLWLNNLQSQVDRLAADRSRTGITNGGGNTSGASLVAWARVEEYPGEGGEILATIFRGEDGRETVLEESAELQIIGAPVDYEPEEGALFVVIRHKGYWEGVLVESTGVPDPPSPGVYVLGAIDGTVDWLDTVQIDYEAET